MNVQIIGPRAEDKAVIKNLFVFYRYDLMPFIASGPGSCVNEFGTIDGESSRTHDEAVADCDIWWEHPGVLSPMLIRADDKPAGFALVAGGKYARRTADYRMCEFFLLSKYRRRGVGARAAAEVFDRFPGRWEVGWLPENVAAAAFWGKVVRAYAHGRCDEIMLDMGLREPALPGLAFGRKRDGAG